MTGPSGSAGDPAYAAQIKRVRAQVAQYLTGLWAQLPDYRDDSAQFFARRAAAIVTAAQQQTAALTATHLTRQVAEIGGIPPEAVATGDLADAVVRGVAAAEVYARPFTQLWWDLSKGVDLAQAVASAMNRSQKLAATDIQLAKTWTARRVFEDSGDVWGYRRVLEGRYSCALCVIASTQRYHLKQLLPIHPACDCSVAPIKGPDEGQIIDPAVLEHMHDTIARDLGKKYVDRGARSPLDYRQVLVQHDHSEIGPLLGVAGQTFTSAADLNQ